MRIVYQGKREQLNFHCATVLWWQIVLPGAGAGPGMAPEWGNLKREISAHIFPVHWLCIFPWSCGSNGSLGWFPWAVVPEWEYLPCPHCSHCLVTAATVVQFTCPETQVFTIGQLNKLTTKIQSACGVRIALYELFSLFQLAVPAESWLLSTLRDGEYKLRFVPQKRHQW